MHVVFYRLADLAVLSVSWAKKLFGGFDLGVGCTVQAARCTTLPYNDAVNNVAT